MFTPISKVGNQYQMREDATGQIWPVSEQTANEMLRNGAIKPGTLANNGGGGGGGYDGYNPNSRAYQAAQAKGMAPRVDPAAAPSVAAPAVPGKLTVVPPRREQQQPQRPQGYSGPALVETVRTPGSKAHWSPQSQSRSGIDQTMQDSLMELEFDNRRKALEANNAMYETTLQRANAESINAQRDRMMAEQEYQRKQVEDSERNAYASNVTRKLQQEVEDVRTQKVSTWHEDQGMGGTILAAISMAMGAYAQGINGGPNGAADIINRAIERDTQKKLGEKQDRLDSAQQKLHNSMVEFGFSADQRKQYMNALGQQQAAAYLKQQAADKELAFAHPMMLQNAAELEARSNQTLTELAKAAQYNATERWVPASGGGVVTRLTPEGQAMELEAGLRGKLADTRGKEAEALRKEGEASGTPKNAIIINGQNAGVAQDEKRKTQLQDAVDGALEVNDMVSTMIDQVGKGGSIFPNKSDADYKRRSVALGRALAKANGEIVRSDEDAITYSEKMQAGYDSISVMNPGKQKAFLETLRQDSLGTARRFLRRNNIDDSLLDDGTRVLPNTQ